MSDAFAAGTVISGSRPSVREPTHRAVRSGTAPVVMPTKRDRRQIGSRVAIIKPTVTLRETVAARRRGRAG
jgi:hypothetical protein